jgi:acetoin utilization deacetylase AcuC-like enzyme
MVLRPLDLATYVEAPRKRRRESAPDNSTWLLIDPLLQRHKHPHRRHSECPERIACMQAALEEAGLAARCSVITCQNEASDEALALVHSTHYVRRLNALRKADAQRLQDEAEQYEDIYLNEHSIGCARLAAGGVLRMAEALWAGTMHNGLALVRPAGHHAGVHGPSGFCLLNNVAVAARQLVQQGCRRVLIVDWDVHHGDGTQQAPPPPPLFPLLLGWFPRWAQRAVAGGR